MDFINEYLIIKAVVIDKKYFGEVFYSVLSTKTNFDQEIKKIKNDVYGILNKYFSLTFQSMNIFSQYGKDSEETILNIIALFHLLNEDKEEVRKQYINAFRRLNLNGDGQENIKLILDNFHGKYVIPDEIKEYPYLYNSLNLEVPEFLFKIITDEQGAKNALDIILGLKKKPYNFYCVNTAKADQMDYLSDNRFEAIKIKNRYLFRFKKPALKPIEDLKEGKLFEITLPLFRAYCEADVPMMNTKVLLLNAHSITSGIYFSTILKDVFNAEVTSCYSSHQIYKTSTNYQKALGLNNINSLFAKPELVKTYLKLHTYDIVVVSGDDLHIGQSATHPGILPSISEKDLEASYIRQQKDLEEATCFAKVGGEIIFINYSLTRRETVDVINTLLSNHSEYEKIISNTIYPQNFTSDGGYYAILKRIK